MSQLDGLSLQFSAHPSPTAVGIRYSRSSSRLLKRKRSETSMPITAVDVSTLSPIILPDIRQDPNEPYLPPPSPVPTEIIDDIAHETCEERMNAAKAAGVKVRDFAYEPLPKGRERRAPEFWTKPLESLILHDVYIRMHPTRADACRLSGKVLHNLLSIGWVTLEEAKRNWRPADWTAMKEYCSRPLGPYPICIASSSKRPTASYRAALRLRTYDMLDDNIPEETIYVPPDEPDMDDGPMHIDESQIKLVQVRVPSNPPTAVYRPTTYGELDNAASIAFSIDDIIRLEAEAAVLAWDSKKATVGEAHTTNQTSDQSLTQATSPPNHTTGIDAVHIDKRRRVSDPSQPSSGASTTPPNTPLVNSGHKTSQTLSHSSSLQSRAATPPLEDASPAYQSSGRGLARTQTLARIPVR